MPRIAVVVGTVLALLLIVPLAYVIAARPGSAARLPSTSGANSTGRSPEAAAIAGVENRTGLRYAAKCSTATACLSVISQTVGQNAVAVVFATASSGGRQCVGYVIRRGGSWKFLDAVCGLPEQLTPLVGRDATVHLAGTCAHVGSAAGVKAAVVECLAAGTTVHIDGGPTYADGLMWWHDPRGWIAHDFLVAP